MVQKLRSTVAQMPEKDQEWQALMDRAQAMREAYNGLQEQLRQAKLAEAIKQGNASVVDVATNGKRLEASWSRALLFQGRLVCSSVSLWRSSSRLSMTPSTRSRTSSGSRTSTCWVLSPSAPTKRTAASSPSPHPRAHLRRPTGPCAATFGSRLFDQPASTFVVSSAGTGEGKSLTVANLAVAYAQSGEKVIVVDTDLRRPVLHKTFGLDGTLGLTNYLVGDSALDDVLQDTEVTNLRLLASGPLPPNPAELLESEQMEEIIQQLRNRADIVIFNSPPAVMLTDAGILASKIDRTILVAESGQITQRAIRDMERLFAHARANVLGIVLNKLRLGGGDYYYYYYYYYYDYGSRRGEQRQTEPANGTNGTNGTNGSSAKLNFAQLNGNGAADKQGGSGDEPS